MTTNKYTIRLKSCGNPDHGQYGAVSDPKVVQCDSLEECAKACRAYIEEWFLGGGNWPRIYVIKNGKRVAQVSYNGRVWSADGKAELCAS